MKNEILVLGVGNSWRRDDGVGPAVIELLCKNPVRGVKYLVGGIDGLALIDIMQQYKKVIIIDAVDMNVEPGSIKIFDPCEAKINIKSDALSTHGFGLAEVLKLIEHLGIQVSISIAGIQPQDISFGEGLSAPLKESLSKVVKLIVKECSNAL